MSDVVLIKRNDDSSRLVTEIGIVLRSFDDEYEFYRYLNKHLPETIAVVPGVYETSGYLFHSSYVLLLSNEIKYLEIRNNLESGTSYIDLHDGVAYHRDIIRKVLFLSDGKEYRDITYRE